MPAATLRAADSVIAVIDLQPSFLSGIYEPERVLQRAEFLMKVAKLIDAPLLATEQYPSRMGGTHERLVPLLEGSAQGKMAFSCAGCDEFISALEQSRKRQVVLAGIETHICVSQTAHDLLEKGYEVIVAADAVSARTEDRHRIGLERIRAAGAVVAHGESIAYEWMQTAENDRFRDVLRLVKEYA